MASGLANLPPTPEEVQCAELVMRMLSLIRESTDNIMRIVSDHAFGGFPRADAEKERRAGVPDRVPRPQTAI